jgi:Xaa-Pro aminopeptidase
MRPRTIALPWLIVLAALVSSCGDDSTTAPPPPPTPYQPAAYREAGRITGAGALAAMTRARPDQTEGDVKAIIDGVFRQEGCTEPAFDHIVAAGPHATTLHYFGNDGVLRSGELLLLDIGATSDEIASDCSRTFPVGPAFGARQRELYDLVLEVHRQVTTGVRPGVDTLDDLDSTATALFRASPLRALDDSGTEQTMDVFFTHYLGHYVGKSVHGEDTGWLAAEPFEVGQAVAIEPGLYISSEEIGIRVENTFLVTEQGLECLTCGCPTEVAEIETLREAVPASGPLTAEAGSAP